MAPLKLEGETLGQKYSNYNRLVSNNMEDEPDDIDYENADLDNLLKIDIACKNRHVDYIVKVFQSEDMLYVSRAIKRSTWMITDPQYAHIINPVYLYDHLYPNMTTKGFNKLILNIRLNIKDEVRAEEFFNYYKDKATNIAYKWLPSCSIGFIENILTIHANDIPIKILKRVDVKLAASIYSKKTDIENYLILIETSNLCNVLRFGPKKTKTIMTHYPERIMMHLEKYCKYLHVPTFSKFIKQEDIKDFILSNINRDDMGSWFSEKNIEFFITHIPKEDRFEFVKEIFIDKRHQYFNDKLTSQHSYYWYKYASFDTAFEDLANIIDSEANPTERAVLFTALLSSAGKDINNIYTLLKYYREIHINDSIESKIQLVNLILNHTNSHKFDKKTWRYLNDIFVSMKVYNESSKIDQLFIRSIILYDVLHDENIPDSIQQKFIYDSYKIYQNKLNEEEKEKVFLYLYKYLITKIESLHVKEKNDFPVIVELLKNVLNLLTDWNKDLKDFPEIVDRIKEVGDINEINKFNFDLATLYNVKKSWRKQFFVKSIFLTPTQKWCIDALKYGPIFLEKHKDSVEAMCLNENTPKDFLKKVRIYWPDSLANAYKELFMNRLNQKQFYKAAIKGLYILLTRNDVLDLLEEYAPSKTEIDSSHSEDLEVNIRKHLAVNLFLARPQTSISTALLYAKGDYLKYVLPSINSILYNMNSSKFRDDLPRLLKSPETLQKHIIRIAFAKFKYDELEKIFVNIWKLGKNSSYLVDIFNQTVNMLSEEEDTVFKKDISQLLNEFVDNLLSDTPRNIKLSKIEKEPMLVRPEYWTNKYKLITSDGESNHDACLFHLISNMFEILKFLDREFVAEILLESFYSRFRHEREFSNLVPVYLLKDIFINIWKSINNLLTRADIFTKIYNFLCNSENETTARVLWEVISFFIDNVTFKESKAVYVKMCQIPTVPKCVRLEYWMKSYKFFKSMPKVSSASSHPDFLNLISDQITHVMDDLNIEFVYEMFFENFDDRFSTGPYEHEHRVAVFLLSAKTENVHNVRINRILTPILERSLAMWDKIHNGSNYVQSNLQQIFLSMDKEFRSIILGPWQMLIPIPLYTKIFEIVCEKLSIKENYTLITTRKLALDCVKIYSHTIDGILKDDDYVNKVVDKPGYAHDLLRERLYEESAPVLSKIYIQYLKDDVRNYGASIYDLFSNTLDVIIVWYNYNISNIINMKDPDFKTEILNNISNTSEEF